MPDRCSIFLHFYHFTDTLVVTKDEKNARSDRVRGYPHKSAMIETLKRTTQIDKIGWQRNQSRLL